MLGLFSTLVIILFIAWYYRNELDNYFEILSLSKILWRYIIYTFEYLKFNNEIEDHIQNRIKSILYFQHYENLNMIMLRFSIYCTILS